MTNYVLLNIVSYCKFLYKSKNRHGVHSPFVYELVTKCFNDSECKSEYKLLKAYQKILYKNLGKELVDVSEEVENNTIQLPKIAKISGMSSKNAELLFRIIQYFQPQNVLDVGSSLGFAAVSIALANPSAKVVKVEEYAETAKQFFLQTQKFNLQNVHVITSEFINYCKYLGNNPTPFDLIFFDGKHACEATFAYFDMLFPTVSEHTFWIFNNIHCSSSNKKVWEFIKSHPKVTITIDTFQFGIVFFRTVQAKENFVIRV